MKENVIKKKSFELAKEIVFLFQHLTREKREYVLSKQVAEIVGFNRVSYQRKNQNSIEYVPGGDQDIVFDIKNRFTTLILVQMCTGSLVL